MEAESMTREPTKMERLVAEAHCCPGTGCRGRGLPGWTGYNDKCDRWEDGDPYLRARAAIRAMREPTREVLASFDTWRDPDVALASWREGIDAASPPDAEGDQ